MGSRALDVLVFRHRVGDCPAIQNHGALCCRFLGIVVCRATIVMTEAGDTGMDVRYGAGKGERVGAVSGGIAGSAFYHALVGRVIGVHRVVSIVASRCCDTLTIRRIVRAVNMNFYQNCV